MAVVRQGSFGDHARRRPLLHAVSGRRRNRLGGFALPQLAERIGLRRASLLLGAIWACWHLPQFYIRQADTWHQSFPLYFLQVVALSVAISWLWARTRHSLLLPMLFHAATNNFKDIVPSASPQPGGVFTFHASLVGWLTVALLWCAASVFLATMPRMISEHAEAARPRIPPPVAELS